MPMTKIATIISMSVNFRSTLMPYLPHNLTTVVAREPGRSGARSPLVDRPGRDRYVGLEVAGKSTRRAVGPDDLEGLVEDLGAREVDQPEVERLGHAGEVVVPLEDLAELETGVDLAPAVEESVEVAGHQVEPLVEARVGAGLAGP